MEERLSRPRLTHILPVSQSRNLDGVQRLPPVNKHNYTTVRGAVTSSEMRLGIFADRSYLLRFKYGGLRRTFPESDRSGIPI